MPQRGYGENFARVVAAEPKHIIDTLLDETKIGHGPIFNERNIWLTLAYCPERMQAEPSSRVSTQSALVAAIDNFLTYHSQPSENSRSPRPHPAQAKTKTPSKDVLANNFDSFNGVVSKFWINLSPKGNHILDILNVRKDLLNLDTEITGILIDTFYKGIYLHSDNAIKRQNEYTSNIEAGISFAIAPPTEAAEIAGSSSGAPITPVIKNVSELFTAKFSKKIADLRVENDIKEMKELFQELENQIRVGNAKEGNFIPGQVFFESTEMHALDPKAAKGEVLPSSQTATTGASTNIRIEISKRYSDIDPEQLSKFYEKAKQFRIEASLHLGEFMQSL